MILIINSLEKKLLSIKEAAETFEISYLIFAGAHRRYLDQGKITRKKQTKFKREKWMNCE